MAAGAKGRATWRNEPVSAMMNEDNSEVECWGTCESALLGLGSEQLAFCFPVRL